MKNPINVLSKRGRSLKALLSFFNENELENEDSNPFDYYRSIAENDADLETINILEKSTSAIAQIEEEFFGEVTAKKATISSKYSKLMKGDKEQNEKTDDKSKKKLNNERTF